jgi:putative phosphoesterase
MLPTLSGSKPVQTSRFAMGAGACSAARQNGRMVRIGLISDTHNLLRPEAAAALKGCDRILHAGDICDAAVLEQLRAIAPVTAVRGNNDWGAWADALDKREVLRVEEVDILVLHDLADLRAEPPPRSVRVVVSGHSHKPLVEDRNGVLFVNPGSAGPRRFKLPIAVGELLVDGSQVRARTIELQP